MGGGSVAMAFDHIVGSLARIPMFAELRPLQIGRIAQQAEHCWFRGGDVITRAGAPGDGAYLILSGDVRRTPRAGSPTPPEAIAPGSLVGELAMLVEHVYGATVVAGGPVDCLKLARVMLHDQMCADPDIAERLAGVIRKRLQLTAAELRDIDRLLMAKSPPTRLGFRPPLMLPQGMRTTG
jgi:CRP/FNR family transcriptional regulator, cyclic AMP receptor protein